MAVTMNKWLLLFLCFRPTIHATPPGNAVKDATENFRQEHRQESHGTRATLTNITRSDTPSRARRNDDRGLAKPEFLNLNLKRGQVLASVDTTFRSLSCDVTVSCKGGRQCSCGEDSLLSCGLPMARITHNALSEYDPMTLFCVGVELASARNGTSYDLRTRCKTRGVGKVKYRVYVKKEDRNATLDAPTPTVRYRACLEPLKD